MQSSDSRKDIKKMIQKYVAGTATPEEKAFVEAYYGYVDHADEPELSEQEIEDLRQQTYQNITYHLDKNAPGKRTIKAYHYVAAAALLLMATTAAYIVFNQRVNQPQSDNVAKSHDVAPGSNKALLTLSNGRVIALTEKTDNQTLAAAGLSVATNVKGELIYRASANPETVQQGGSNTVATPKGGQYQVVLSDGTHVWLNAASSLTFPLAFNGKLREVELAGEAYFEVAKNLAMPFHVRTAGQDVEVTGTHFNINAYPESGPIATTLLEGSVIVHHDGHQQQIKPGQQAHVAADSEKTPVEMVDTEAVMAWKNGLFEFNNASLRHIMYQLERWYDIKVDYNSLPAKRYNGTIPRSAKLSQVLKMLEVTGDIRFLIDEDRKVSIQKQ